MKQIVAIVKPYLAEKVLEGLKRAPLEAVSVREVKGYGRQKSYLDQYADSEYSLAFLPKVEITCGSTTRGSRRSCARSSKWPAPAAWATARSSCCQPRRLSRSSIWRKWE